MTSNHFSKFGPITASAYVVGSTFSMSNTSLSRVTRNLYFSGSWHMLPNLWGSCVTSVVGCFTIFCETYSLTSSVDVSVLPFDRTSWSPTLLPLIPLESNSHWKNMRDKHFALSEIIETVSRSLHRILIEVTLPWFKATLIRRQMFLTSLASSNPYKETLGTLPKSYLLCVS